jgi:hypothetical protein
MRNILPALGLLLVVGCGQTGASQGVLSEEVPDETISEQDLVTKPNDDVVTKDIKAAIASPNAIYVSESDKPFSFVMAPLLEGESISEASVRRAFAAEVDKVEEADKPLASLFGASQTFSSWKKNSVGCTKDSFPGPTECAAVKAINDTLTKDLTNVKVYFFGKDGSKGRVDGVGVSIFVVGKTKSGKIAGVRTLAIWT